MNKKHEGQKNSKRLYRRGFTLVEIVTTVAIIGILSAVAVPNFMRLRMEVNMEMVKQALRVAGEKLTEIMGVKGRFPTNGEIGPGATGEDEISLTATLSAIDAKGYTRDYTVDELMSFAMIRSDPVRSPGGGISGAGDRCFIWDPIENVIDIPCWSAQGLNLMNMGLMPGLLGSSLTGGPLGVKDILSKLLSDSNISDQDKAKIIANTFEMAAYQLDWIKINPDNFMLDLPSGAIMAHALLVLDQNTRDALKTILPQVSQILESKGIQMFAGEMTSASNPLVGFKLEKPITSREDVTARMQDVTGTTVESYYRSTPESQTERDEREHHGLWG